MTGNKKQKGILHVTKDSRSRWALFAAFLLLFVTIQTGMTQVGLPQPRDRLPFN